MFGHVEVGPASDVWLQPLVDVGLALAAAVFGLWILLLGLRFVLPKIGAVAGVTAKEALTQPLFYLLLVLGSGLLVLFIFLPYNTFGEDIKMLKNQGFDLVKLLAIILALWTSGVSVAEEIEGRTALTLLSKPIDRRQFILGKFAGVLIPVCLLFVLLGAVFLGTVSYKVVFEAREHAQLAPTAAQCRAELLQTAPGIFLAFLETVVLTSIGVAISTRLPLLPNLVICLVIYVFGHLAPLLLSSSANQFEIVGFAAKFFTTVLPVLEPFSIVAAISGGREVPLSYLAYAACYAAIYCVFSVLIALLLFEDRDLA